MCLSVEGAIKVEEQDFVCLYGEPQIHIIGEVETSLHRRSLGTACSSVRKTVSRTVFSIDITKYPEIARLGKREILALQAQIQLPLQQEQ